MSSTQYYFAQSLDGYIADAEGGIDWLTRFDGESVDVVQATDGAYEEFFAEVGALAMGSATYEFILEEAGEWPYGERPTWVFTTRELPRLPGAEVRFVRGPVAPVHAFMKSAAGERNLWIVGGGKLAMQFADEGLLDELIVTVVPVVLGQGIPALPGPLRQRLRLAGTRPFGNGMVELRYALR